MPLLVKPAEISKGEDAVFVLDRTGLSQLAIVQADQYFADTDNWSEIELVYSGPFGNKEIARFNAQLLNPSSNFSLSTKLRGVLELESIIIKDFDYGYLLIPSDQILVTDFDIAFSPDMLLFMSAWIDMLNIYSLSEDYSG